MTAASLESNRGAPQRVPTKVVAATVAGNALEFYDFTV